jgi:ribosomal protein L11 methylase PrmA
MSCFHFMNGFSLHAHGTSCRCIEIHSSFIMTRGQHSMLQADLHNIAGRACLELGCGSGLLGVVLSRLNAVCAVLTDGDSNALDNCRRNVAANNTTTCVDSGKSIGSACHVSS